MLQSVGICVIFKISAEPQTVVYSLKTIFMSKFIASPGVSVTLHLFHALCNIQSPFVEFAFQKCTQIWYSEKKVIQMFVVVGLRPKYASVLLFSGL